MGTWCDPMIQNQWLLGYLQLLNVYHLLGNAIYTVCTYMYMHA